MPEKAATRTAKTAKTKSPVHSVYNSDSELRGAIEALAKEREWSISDVYKEAVKEYLGKDRLRQEFGEFEKRIAASYRAMTKEQRRIRNDLEIFMAMFDLFIRSYFVHTPSVPPEAVEFAAADGWQRYEKLISQLPEMMRSGGGALGAAMAANMENDAEG